MNLCSVFSVPRFGAHVKHSPPQSHNASYSSQPLAAVPSPARSSVIPQPVPSPTLANTNDRGRIWAAAPGFRWFAVKDGDPRGFALMRNHYSYQPYADGRRQDPTNPNRKLFVGPGQKMVLMTVDCRALFVWRKFIDRSGQQGVNCAVFHNAGPHLSSDLILEAEQLAWQRWPGERLYTYVNARKIKSVNPGYCFKMAGWHPCGRSATRRLHILEKLAALPVFGSGA